MQRNMKILYIAPECKPYSKAGGLADVAGELPPALKKESKKLKRNVDIEIVTPFYGCVDPKYVVKDKNPEKFSVQFDNKLENFELHEANLGGVTVYLLKNSTYFEGEKYRNPFVNDESVPFLEDTRRFSFFSKALVEIIKEKKPDVVHVNDWGLGYLFGWMKQQHMPQKRVLTVHNAAYQGNIGKENIKGWDIEKLLNAPDIGHLLEDPRTDWNSINPLRLGLELADVVHTVSPGYAKEMTQPDDPSKYFEGGKGLEQITKRLYDQKMLIGILNGYNYKYEPTDSNFETTLEEKAETKNELSRGFKNPKNLLIGFVGRAAYQKCGILAEKWDFDGTKENKTVLEHILDIPGVNFIALANGEQKYSNFMKNAGTVRYDGSASYDEFLKKPVRENYVYTHDNAVAPKIFLGSDLFFMPSIYEPCGITQLGAMSYATPPVVRKTGGLGDTVENGKTGFCFDGNTRSELFHSLFNSLHEAIDMYRSSPKKFRTLQRNAFQQRFVWKNSAKEYLNKLY